MVAIVATTAVFIVPMAWARPFSVTDATLLGAGVLVLVGVYVRVRTAVARRQAVALRHRSWMPAVGFGLAATAVGFGWAPLPVSEPEEAVASFRWIGAAVLGAITVVLLLLSGWFGVPFTRALGSAGLVMTASVLMPVSPYDGAFVGRALNLVLSLALLSLAVLVFGGVL